MLEEFRQHLASDPESATLHGIIKQAFLIPMTRPLIKGMVLGDTDMLGELAHREYADPASVTQRRLEMGRAYQESAELLEETAHRTFEPDEPVTFKKVQEVQTIFVQLLDGLLGTVKERIQREAEL